MLTSTFVHTPGIGYTTERKLWASGALTWSDCLQMADALPLSVRQRDLLTAHLARSEECLKGGDHRFFSQWLPTREHWRAFPEFSGRTAFLDIETTGLGWEAEVTVVGLLTGQKVHQFVRGENLREFPEYVRQCSLLVTFYGTSFDLPFLKREFPGLRIDQLHVDLCYAMRRLGFTGGLKRIEGKLGLARSEQTRGLSGYDAVVLWGEWKRGSRAALDLLLRYNYEDVSHLESLMRFAYERLRSALGLRDSGLGSRGSGPGIPQETGLLQAPGGGKPMREKDDEKLP
jgi:hypothetical protein